MHPDEELLAALALGEPVDPADAAHVAGCPRCATLVAELGETVALARDGAREELVSPPDSVWQAIAAEVEAGAAGVTPMAGGNDELAGRRRPGLGWLALAAAVGVVAGAGAVLLPDLLAPAPAVAARAPLKTLDTGTQRGEAELLTQRDRPLDLRVRVEPLEAGDGYLEVWLINTDLKRMVSVGVLPGAATTQDFAVTPGLIEAGYVIVDISREQFDESPLHSGDSLLRGSLA